MIDRLLSIEPCPMPMTVSMVTCTKLLQPQKTATMEPPTTEEGSAHSLLTEGTGSSHRRIGRARPSALRNAHSHQELPACTPRPDDPKIL